jgi:hypothetical protein
VSNLFGCLGKKCHVTITLTIKHNYKSAKPKRLSKQVAFFNLGGFIHDKKDKWHFVIRQSGYPEIDNTWLER